MRFKHLNEIIGKRISHVVVKERSRQPMGQVIIVFEDGDCYEFYSQHADLSGSGMSGTGGLAEAQRYMAQEATLIKTYPEP